MRKPVPFGKYCLLERISVGGMAEVFKAKQFGAQGFAKTIAIKRILPNMAEDQEFITMFIDEAKIAVQLNHANICQIYELGKIFSSHYIVMEYIPGKDLLQINNHFKRNRKRMPVEMACYVVSKVCEGLDYAHRKRDQNFQDLHLVHRDISPQNVLVSHGGEVKIIDFGIAKAATRSTKTQVGVLKGKFGYMSPEQVRGLPLDRRSDIFAAGTVLYEILTCKRLFVADTDFATLEKVRKVDVDPPSKIRPDIPDELERIILKALARERDERYQWASEFQEDLQRFLVHSSRPYASHQMAEWMGTTFAEEVAKSKEKDEYYATIRSAEDLRDADEPEHEPFDADQLEDKGEATVIYAQADEDPDPRPDFELDDNDRLATPLTGDSLAAMTEEVDRPPSELPYDPAGIDMPGTERDQPLAAPVVAADGEGDPSDDEPTQAVSGITDAQFEEIMASQAAPPAEPAPEVDEGPAPTPLAIPRKANKFAANTMALSADEIEVLAEDEEDLFGGDDPDPVPPPGAPLGGLFDDMILPAAEGPKIDVTGATVSPDAPMKAVPRAPLPKIPSIVKNPEPAPKPPPPVAAPAPAPLPLPAPAPAPIPVPIPAPAAAPAPPSPALAESGPMGFGETMMPEAVRPPPAKPLPPPPAVAPPPDAVLPPPPAPAPVALPMGSGPAPFAEQGTGPAFTATSKRRRLMREVVIGTLVAGIILAGGVAAWWFFLGGARAAVAPGTASLLIEVDPADDLEIKLDGRKLADASPARLDGLSPGRHKLEVRAEGHLPHKVELELPDGELATHSVTLEEGEQPVAQLKLDVTPRGGGTTVSLGGANFGYDPDGPSAWMDLTAGEPHTVVVSRRGFKNQTLTVTLEPQDKKSLEVTLVELVGSLRLTSSPSGARVYVNDKKAGKTPFAKDGLPADNSYDVMLTKKGYEDWLDTVEFTPDSPTYEQNVDMVRKGKKGKKGKGGGNKPSAGAAASGVGYLTVSAGTDVWAKVFVDGQDTGLSTPIQTYNKLELPEGAHTVTLKMGDKSLDKTVQIKSGETTKVRTRLR